MLDPGFSVKRLGPTGRRIAGDMSPSPTPGGPPRFTDAPGSPSVEEVLAEYSARRSN